MIVNIKKYAYSTLSLGGFALIALSLSACSEEKQKQEKRPRPVLVVEANTTASGPTLKSSALVRARHRASLSFALPGRVAERLVEVGDRVESGQLLARLDSKQIRNAKRGAQAVSSEAHVRLAQLRRDKQRVESLHKRNAASSEELEKISAAVLAFEAKIQGAQVQVGEAKRQLSDTRIVAPFAGVITHVGIESGEFAQPGFGVIRLSGDQELEAELEIPETMLSQVTRGSEVEVSLPIQGIIGLRGQIRSINKVADQGRMFSAIVALDKHRALMPGVTAEFKMHSEGKPGVSVPISAIFSPSGGKTYLYRLGKNSQVEKISVDVKELRGRNVRIEGELQSGDKVVVAGHTHLGDGQVVAPRDLSSSPLHSEFSQ